MPNLGGIKPLGRIFIDTSVFIRLFTRDLKRESEDCEKLISEIEKGNLLGYISNIVLLEIFFVLTRIYKFKKEVVGRILKSVLKIRNITLIEKTNSRNALKLLDQFKIKYADCLIADQVPQNAILVTYDSEFRKIKRLKLATPGQIIKD